MQPTLTNELTIEDAMPVSDGTDPEVVITPGGARLRSQVKPVAAGEVIKVARRRKPVETINRGVFSSRPLRAEWIVAAVRQGGAVQQFVGDIVVPAEPDRSNGQTLYIFTGLQDDPVSLIFQPVLQWGAAGDPPGWRLCSWMVDNRAREGRPSRSVATAPGARVRAFIRYNGRREGKYSYTCGFDGVTETHIDLLSPRALSTAVAVLEAYGVQGSKDYPPDPPIRFEGVRLSQDRPGDWRTQNIVIDGGQRANIVKSDEPCIFELRCR